MTALGVLCYFALFVCLTLLASFFLPSHLSFKNMYMYMYLYFTLYHVYSIYNAGKTILGGAGHGTNGDLPIYCLFIEMHCTSKHTCK